MGYQSWIKVEANTIKKPEVLSMSESLGIDVYAVYGRLMCIWTWFDEQTENGSTQSITVKSLDRIVEMESFCESMIKVGWMKDDGNAISLPNFDRHNGTTAKQRALSNRRMSKSRAKNNNSDEVSVTNVTPASSQNAQPDIDEDEDINNDRYMSFITAHQILNKAGIPEKWLVRKDDRIVINKWIENGISKDILLEAIKRAITSKQGEPFGVRYLDPIIKQVTFEKNNPTNPSLIVKSSKLSKGLQNAKRYEKIINE